MKNVLTALICFFSLTSFAQLAPVWQNSADAASVILAVSQAAPWATMHCPGTVSNEGAIARNNFNVSSVFDLIQKSQVVMVNVAANQPRIVLKNTADYGNSHYSTVIYVTTSADGKSVTQLDLEQQTTTVTKKNHGTLEHPNFHVVSTSVTETKATCN